MTPGIGAFTEVKGEYLYKNTIFCEGEIEGFEEIRIDDIPDSDEKFQTTYNVDLTLDWSGYVIPDIDPDPVATQTLLEAYAQARRLKNPGFLISRRKESESSYSKIQYRTDQRPFFRGVSLQPNVGLWPGLSVPEQAMVLSDDLYLFPEDSQSGESR